MAADPSQAIRVTDSFLGKQRWRSSFQPRKLVPRETADLGTSDLGLRLRDRRRLEETGHDVITIFQPRFLPPPPQSSQTHFHCYSSTWQEARDIYLSVASVGCYLRVPVDSKRLISYQELYKGSHVSFFDPRGGDISLNDSEAHFTIPRVDTSPNRSLPIPSGLHY